MLSFLRRTDDELYKKLVRFAAENERLRKENGELRSMVGERMRVPLEGFDDNEPNGAEEPEKRAQYVGKVSFLFESVLREKLLASVGSVREELAKLHTDSKPQGVRREEFDWFLRGTENALWLMYDWASILSGEHKQNLEDNKT